MEKPLKITICSQKFLLLISFLQNTFISQYSFLSPSDILLARNSPKILLAKFPPQKNLLLQNMLPKISSLENSFKKKIVPHFAPLIFIQKNLLPKFFLPRTCCQTFLLSIFLLIMKFYFKNSSKMFLLASNTWSLKFPPRKICFKKKLFPILPPPPKKKKIHSKEFAPQIFPPKNLLPNLFALHITSHKKLLPKFCSPKSLLPTILWSSYGT